MLNATVLFAQAPRPKAQPPRQTLNLNAKLQGLRPGLLQVVTEQGEQWLVKVTNETRRVTYTAIAEPSWLRTGMWVQFTVILDKRGRAQAPIKDLTVFTPDPTRRIGVHSDSSPMAELNFFGETNPHPQAGTRGSANKPTTTAVFDVAGRITALKNGNATVAAGNASVEAPLAENVSVNVEIADLRWARPGDDVLGRAWYYQKGQAWANEIIVRADEKLKPVQRKPARSYSEQERKQALADLNSLLAGENAVFGEEAVAEQTEDGADE